MEQRLNVVTVAVADVARSRRFYVDGLGWQAAAEAPGEVLFVRVARGVVLALWHRERFAEEIGREPATGLAPFTLAHNVDSPAAVDEVLDTAVAAGARLVSAGTDRGWGGYTGYFADPDGFLWEVAYNPGTLGVALLAESADS
ncbi:MAG TPA: VOC family protein [Pilimelia sp.]|nr:VOC family protein [Pilimelia sp.]